MQFFRYIVIILVCAFAANMNAQSLDIGNLVHGVTSDKQADSLQLLIISTIEKSHNAKKTNQLTTQFDLQMQLVYHYEQLYDYHHALQAALEARNVGALMNDAEKEGQASIWAGKIHLIEKNLELSGSMLTEGLNLLKNTKDNNLLATAYEWMGHLLFEKKIMGEAQFSFDQAISLYTKAKNVQQVIALTNRQGTLRLQMGDYESASLHFQTALDYYASMEQIPGLIQSMLSLTEVYEASKDMDQSAFWLGNLDPYSLGEMDSLQLLKYHLLKSDFYFGTQQSKEGKLHLIQAADLAKALGNTPQILPLLTATLKRLEDQKMSSESMAISKTLLIATAAQNQLEKQRILLQQTAKYNSNLAVVKANQQLEVLEIEQKAAQKRQFFLVGLLLLALAVLGLVFTLYRIKKRDNQLLEAKNAKIEEQKLELAASNRSIESINETLERINGRLTEEIGEREAIEKSAFAKDRFVAVVSHEMRTPLNSISGLTHLLLEDDPRPDQKVHLQNLTFAANHLLVFINDILDYTRIEAGKLSLDERAFDFHKTMENLQDRWMMQFSASDFNLNLNLEQGIPVQLMGDPTRLDQVLSSIITAGVKETQENNHFDLAITHVDHQKDEVMLSFHIMLPQNNGGNKSMMRDIYKPYHAEQFQLSNSNEQNWTLGLSRRLIELQNGRIEMIEHPDKQRSIVFELPFKKAANQSGNVPTMEYYKNSFKGKRVLLVEDNKINQLVVAQMLKKLDIEVLLANNGLEGFQLFLEEHVDLVLMDIQMPKMDGYRTTAEIRKHPNPVKQNVPIIALTASAFLTEKEKAKLFGMNDHVGKPFSPEELLEKMAQCLEAI